jgi:hypothetical protein
MIAPAPTVIFQNEKIIILHNDLVLALSLDEWLELAGKIFRHYDEKPSHRLRALAAGYQDWCTEHLQ